MWRSSGLKELECFDGVSRILEGLGRFGCSQVISVKDIVKQLNLILYDIAEEHGIEFAIYSLFLIPRSLGSLFCLHQISQSISFICTLPDPCEFHIRVHEPRACI